MKRDTAVPLDPDGSTTGHADCRLAVVGVVREIELGMVAIGGAVIDIENLVRGGLAFVNHHDLKVWL
jgi:hypothetical protein